MFSIIFLELFFSDINYDMFACVISICCIVNDSSLLRLTLQHERGKNKINNTENKTRIQHVYTTHIQHEIHTIQKIQHKVSLLGAGLEVLFCSPCQGAKRRYRNCRYVILYQNIYIEIYIFY